MYAIVDQKAPNERNHTQGLSLAPTHCLRMALVQKLHKGLMLRAEFFEFA
jgi:hypothetical protein